MKTKFTIGEFSKISSLTIDTLRYYDKIGLLSPEYTNPSSKYRYYGMNQLMKSEIIKFNSDVGMKLSDMKELFMNKNPDELRNVLEKQKETLVQQSLKIKNSIEKLENIQSALNGIEGIKEEGDLYIIDIPKRKIAYVDYNNFDQNDSNWYIDMYKELLSILQVKEINIKYSGGFLLFLKGDKIEDATVFEEVTKDIEGTFLKIIDLPAGKHLCVNYYEKNHNKYELKLINECKKRNIKIDRIIKKYILTGDFDYLERRFELQVLIEEE